VGPGSAGCRRALIHELLPADVGAVWRWLRVREEQWEGRILEFQIAAWRQSFVCGPDDVWVVSKAHYQSAAVNVRERLLKKPFVFGIVNFEAAVYRDMDGLNW